MTHPRTAIYARISQDDGSALGVARQEKDCRSLADSRGWTVTRVFTDNDVSASRGNVRPAYRDMLAAIEAGDFDALVVWDVDRLTRTPRELEDVIDLADRSGLALASVGGEIDLATPQGRLTARIKGTVARHEVEQMSRRIRRQSDERAAAGTPHGRAGYGFRRVDGRDIADPAEAAVIREAASRLLEGESLRAVAADLNRRAVPSPSGMAPWRAITLRQMLKRTNLAGLRQHRGQVVGRSTGDAILDRDTHDRLVALFSDPARARDGVGRPAQHLLSGLAVCGLCGGKVRALSAWTTKRDDVATRHQPAAYSCGSCFKVRRKQEPVDALIEEVVLRRLEAPDAAEAFTRGDEGAVRKARADLAAIDARLAVAADQFADGVLTGDQLRRITEKLRAERARLDGMLSAALPLALPRTAVGPDARNVWAGLSIDARRSIVDALVVVTILPAAPGRRGFDPESVAIHWRD